jgi:hypothetical protein
LALVEKYFAVDEAVALHPGVPLKRYYEVAAGPYANELQRGAQSLRAKGYRVKGRTRAGTAQVQALNLTSGKQKRPAARVRVCVDVSDVKVVDKHGRSVVDADRPDAYYEVLRLEKQQKFGWRVVDGSDSEAPTCAA